jgi:hypothetical protein
LRISLHFRVFFLFLLPLSTAPRHNHRLHHLLRFLLRLCLQPPFLVFLLS